MIRPPPIQNVQHKRQHLPYYTLDEQRSLIGHARELLERAKGGPVQAFRAGSFAANRDTFVALRDNGLWVDSSLNEAHDHSAGSLALPPAWQTVHRVEGVTTYPVTVFRDGFGQPRPAHVGACSFLEMRQALLSARAGGCRHFVIVSHNFEMLKPGSSRPDPIVVSRFERLCAFLASEPSMFQVGTYPPPCALPAAQTERRPAVSPSATALRHLQQLASRVL